MENKNTNIIYEKKSTKHSNINSNNNNYENDDNMVNNNNNTLYTNSNLQFSFENKKNQTQRMNKKKGEQKYMGNDLVDKRKNNFKPENANNIKTNKDIYDNNDNEENNNEYLDENNMNSNRNKKGNMSNNQYNNKFLSFHSIIPLQNELMDVWTFGCLDVSLFLH